MAGGHAQPRDPSLLRNLSAGGLPPDNAAYFSGNAARWYDATYAWRTEDIGFYEALAGQWAGPGGAVLELGAGSGRITLPLARAGFRITAVDSSADMIELLRRRLGDEPASVVERVEPVEQDLRRLRLDRLYRFICLPFNTLLMFSQSHERQQALDAVREHLAPSGAFAFEVFTPDPARLVTSADWEVDLEHDIEGRDGEGKVHVRREIMRGVDIGRQVMHNRFRHRVSTADDGRELASWEDEMTLAFIFPRELDLLLERQGFGVKARYGGPAMEPYDPTPENVQPQYVVAQLIQ
ncbi:MAG: methyltransferase domain-containing protein [Candidatus Dormibacteraeota bacterium]|nr:methyltransferase domain-containing protein [Candidatus Dormibacteraeota bacterium]